ncbi:MAG: prolyl oligopeptidase family serine peptidase [Pirellulaceae bacterium]
MKSVFLVVGCMFAVPFTASLVSAEDPQPGKQVHAKTTVMIKNGDKEEPVEIRYLLFLPQGHGSAEKKDEKWPLLLFLHGAGERGNDNLDLVKKHGPPKIVDEKKDFPFITVSPQCPEGKRWNAQELAKLVDALANTYSADPQRLYVTGLSLGGFGSWNLLAEYPGKFAAAIPICGGGDPATAEKMKGTPIWVFHGAKDTAVSISQSEAMVDALKKAGGNVKFTMYPEAGHDSWTETYNNPEVYKWLLEQKK